MKGTMGIAGRSLGLLLVLWLAPGPAMAQTRQVRRYLNAAATLYENLEYEKALAQIERARKKSTGPEDDAAIALYEGIVLSDMGKEEKALTAFKTGLSLDPDAKLPLEVSPKVEATFERARASVKKLLAPQLAQEQAQEERERQEAEQRKAEELRRQQEAQQPKLTEVKPRVPPPAVGASPEVHAAAPPASAARYAWIPAAGGAVCAGAGAFLLVQAKASYDALTSGSAPANTAASLRDQGKVEQVAGFALIGAGAVGLGVAGAMLLGGSGGDARVGVLLGPGHAGLAISGALP